MAYQEIGTVQAGAVKAHLEKIHGVYERTLTLTQAQLRALDSTPIEVIPNPGAGKVAVPTRMITERAAGTTYTAATRIRLQYGTTTTVQPISDTAGNVAGASASVRYLERAAAAEAVHANEPVNIAASAAMGNGTGTLTVTVQYIILVL